MPTPEQEQWLQHLSDEKPVVIIPFDQTAEAKFQILKQRVHDALGPTIEVVHRGSTMLGISGQNEIDVYIPVAAADFDGMHSVLQGLFGEARAIYPMQRVRFLTFVDDKHIDLFLINREHDDWIKGTAFERYCLEHPETLEEYRQLKESMNGWTIQEFYRRKNEFFDKVLSRIK